MRPIEVRRLTKSDRVAWRKRDTSWCPRTKRRQSSKSLQPWRPRRHVARLPLLRLRLQSYRSMPRSSLSQGLSHSLRKCSQRRSPCKCSQRPGLRKCSQGPGLRQADCKSLCDMINLCINKPNQGEKIDPEVRSDEGLGGLHLPVQHWFDVGPRQLLGSVRMSGEGRSPSALDFPNGIILDARGLHGPPEPHGARGPVSMKRGTARPS